MPRHGARGRKASADAIIAAHPRRGVQQPFRIGESYRVEPSLNRVTGPGGIHRLEPKVMLVLACLAERAGQVVPKDRLIQSVWADTAVTDDVLTRAISELRRLFDDDPRQPRVIETIAKGGYRLIAPIDVLGAPDDANPPPSPSHIPVATRRGRRAVMIGAAGIMVALAAGVWLSRTHRAPPAAAMRVVPLTAMSGSEFGAVFSPDGRQLGFAWNGEIPDDETRAWWGGHWDIYVKLVGSSEVRRLTTDPGVDLAPAWSPDGRQIAYVRSEPPYRSQRIRVMSALGGSDREVSDFPIWLPAAWSPDGRYLVAGRAGPPDAAHPTNGLYLIPVQGGEPRAITQPHAPGVDQSPAFSPDGHRLAYASCDEYRVYCHVQVVNLDATFAAVGSPRRLTSLLRMPRGSVTWSRDRQFVIFNAEEMQLNYLWRVAVDGQAGPERIEQAGVGAFFPSVSPADDRLAFTRMLHDEDVYSFEPGRSAHAVARSSVFDGTPQFSPDGQRIAFCSLRSGDAMEVWAANADGSSPAQLTHGPSRYQCGPAWSPDGRRIAFESAAEDEHPHIWTVDAQGGSPVQITIDPGDQLDPSWSRDGDWIYFSWGRENDRDIWRVRVANGTKERVTRGGGFVARESMDGTELVYIPKAFHSPLLAQPLAGGRPRALIDCVEGTAFSVVQSGIYYLPCSRTPALDPNPVVHVMNPVTMEDREVGRLEKFQYETLPSGFTVSPNGQTLVYDRLVRDEADLMMIEHFR